MIRETPVAKVCSIYEVEFMLNQTRLDSLIVLYNSMFTLHVYVCYSYSYYSPRGGSLGKQIALFARQGAGIGHIQKLAQKVKARHVN